MRERHGERRNKGRENEKQGTEPGNSPIMSYVTLKINNTKNFFSIQRREEINTLSFNPLKVKVEVFFTDPNEMRIH